MNDLVGKSCKVWVKVENKDFFYSVRKVLKFENPHLTFVDKFDKEFTFHKEQIREIREVGKAW